MKDEFQKYRQELKNWYKEYKASQICVLCGSTKKKELHHLDPATKDDSISHLVHQGMPKEQILEELDKCVCLCRKCHKRVHKEMKESNKAH